MGLVPEELATTALPTDLPAPTADSSKPSQENSSEEFYKQSLGQLGYPGFAYLKAKTAVNPEELLLRALDEDDLDARVVEALPWLPLRFPNMNWERVIPNAELRKRQNRLGFVVALAMQAGQGSGEKATVDALAVAIQRLERTRLATEDTLCKASLSKTEQVWLRSHRTDAAAHWNLLTDLKVEHLAHIA